MSRAPIAVIVSRFPLVTETFILREIVELERQGQPVVLVPMIRETPEVVHEAAKPWVERALYTPWMFRVPLRAWPLLLRLILGTLRRPGTLLRTLALFPKAVWLAGELQRRGVQHIHAHFATHPTTMALVMSTLTGIPFSFTVHAHDIQLDRSLLRWKIREARFVRSISEFNRRLLEDLYPEEAQGKIEVIHAGVPLPSALGPLPSAPKVLCVAALKPYKGLPVLIEACRLAGVRCDIVGDGPMRAELEALNHDNVVTFLGARDEAEVARLMDECSLFVLPSIVAPDGQMEGIPVALMEALARGRPVVSTRISGIPELVQDGVNGLLVEPGDAHALARAMRELLDDRERARVMGERGREIVGRDFELSGCVGRLLAKLGTFDIVDAIAESFRMHGVRVVRSEHHLTLPDHNSRVEVYVSPAGRTCRLDVILHLAGGQRVVESFGGWGHDPVAGAFENFLRSSFHVLLRAFLAPGPDEQVDVETWEIGGRRYLVTIGSAFGRGGPGYRPPTDWFPAFEAAVRGSGELQDVNWVRVYYAHFQRKPMAVEVLLNNETWSRVEQTVAALPWPESEEFYSVRLFLVLSTLR